MDQFFRDKLDQYQSRVTRNVWENLDARLSEENGKPRPYLWLILIALVILTLGYLFYRDVMAENEQAPVELEDDAIASLESFPRSLKINYYQKENDNNFYVKTDQWVGHASSAFTHLPQDPGKQPFGSAETIADKSDISGSESLMNTQPAAPGIKLPGVNFGLSGEQTSDFALPDYKDHCYTNSNHYFFVELNAGLDLPFQRLGVQHFASETQQYLDKRANTEYGFISYNANLLAGYIHPSGFLAKTGVQYAQLNEKFSLIKQSIVKIQTQITIDTMFKEDGTYLIQRDTTTTEIMGEEKLTSNNHFRMVDIPLIIGYRYAGANFGLEVNTGLIFNLMNYSSGRIFDESIHPSYYGVKGDGDFSPFKTRVGLSLYTGIRYMTGFYGRTQFYIEPNLRYYFNSFSNSDYPLSQKYLVLGVTSGMKYFF